MKTTIPIKDSFESFVYKTLTPDGPAYITLIEDYPGKIHKVIFNVGRNGTAVNAWGHCVGELVSTLFEKGTSLTDVINLISHITSERTVRTIDGIESRSGPEALFNCLMRYKASIPKPSITTHRPARIRRSRV